MGMMKNRIFYVFLFVNLWFGAKVWAQQKISEGKVVYAITYPDMDLDPQMMAMLPAESVVYFKDHWSRTDMNMGTGIYSVTIINSKTKEVTTLMDMMGTKTATVIPEPEETKDKGKSPDNTKDFELLNEKKEIAGYPCKKAILKNTDGTSFELFYTDFILSESQFAKQWNNFKGFPMEYVIVTSGFNMKLVAKEVSGETVSDTLFTIPPDYKLITQEEFSKMLEGN